MLLAVNGALLATFAAALLARTATVGRHRPNWSMAADGASRASPVLTGAYRTVAHALGYVRDGASELTDVALTRVREHPGGQQEVTFFAIAIGVAMAMGLLIALWFGG
jgi:hypothetical protein